MAWVRYDDVFHTNPKVTAVLADNPAALSLHLVANTWTNSQKRPGFIPAHQPAVLIVDRQLGPEWAAVLVRHGLWHERGRECAECLEEYAELPPDMPGYVIHNAREYRAPARDRVVAGTPPDLSEKRREAGRKGGQISAARRKREEDKQSQAKQASAQAKQAMRSASTSEPPARDGDADPTALWPGTETDTTAETPSNGQANGVSKSSKLLFAGVSPEPVPVTTSTSNEVEAQSRQAALEGMPDAPGKELTPRDQAFGIGRDWIKRRAAQKTPVVGKGKTDPIHALRSLIEPFVKEGYTDNEIKRALDDIGESIPSTAQLDRALSRLRSPNSQGRRNGQLGAGSPRRLTNSHENVDRYDIPL